MHDVGDGMPVPERKEGLAVGDVEDLDGHAACQEGRNVRPVMTGHDDVRAGLDQGQRRVRPDRPQTAGDEDHRRTS